MGTRVPRDEGGTMSTQWIRQALRRSSREDSRQDLLEWGPHPTAVEQLDAVLRAEKFPDWRVLASKASSLTDDRPLNEYFLVRRTLR